MKRNSLSRVKRFFGRCLDVLARATNLNDTGSFKPSAPNNRARLASSNSNRS
jgi:hypothetical protein